MVKIDSLRAMWCGMVLVFGYWFKLWSVSLDSFNTWYTSTVLIISYKELSIWIFSIYYDKTGSTSLDSSNGLTLKSYKNLVSTKNFEDNKSVCVHMSGMVFITIIFAKLKTCWHQCKISMMCRGLYKAWWWQWSPGSW